MLEKWAHAIVELHCPAPPFETLTPLEHRYLMSAWRKQLRRQGVKFKLEHHAH